MCQKCAASILFAYCDLLATALKPLLRLLVPGRGLEPLHLAAADFES
jgi:hypothetical protein